MENGNKCGSGCAFEAPVECYPGRDGKQAGRSVSAGCSVSLSIPDSRDLLRLYIWENQESTLGHISFGPCNTVQTPSYNPSVLFHPLCSSPHVPFPLTTLLWSPLSLTYAMLNPLCPQAFVPTVLSNRTIFLGMSGSLASGHGSRATTSDRPPRSPH